MAATDEESDLFAGGVQGYRRSNTWQPALLERTPRMPRVCGVPVLAPVPSHLPLLGSSGPVNRSQVLPCITKIASTDVRRTKREA